MTVANRLQQLTAVDWWDKLSEIEQQAYFKANTNSKIKLKQISDVNRKNNYDILLKKEKIGEVSLAGKHPCIETVRLNPKHQGKGFGKHIYNALEQLLKRPLVPSPLGLSPPAIKIWQKRLALLPPKHAKQLIDEAFHLGNYMKLNPKNTISILQPLLKNWRPPAIKTEDKSSLESMYGRN